MIGCLQNAASGPRQKIYIDFIDPFEFKSTIKQTDLAVKKPNLAIFLSPPSKKRYGTFFWATKLCWLFTGTYLQHSAFHELHRDLAYMFTMWIPNKYTLWLFNIAMENCPFIDGLPGFTY